MVSPWGCCDAACLIMPGGPTANVYEKGEVSGMFESTLSMAGSTKVVSVRLRCILPAVTAMRLKTGTSNLEMIGQGFCPLLGCEA